jgi:hypothetical protein
MVRRYKNATNKQHFWDRNLFEFAKRILKYKYRKGYIHPKTLVFPFMSQCRTITQKNWRKTFFFAEMAVSSRRKNEKDKKG